MNNEIVIIIGVLAVFLIGIFLIKKSSKSKVSNNEAILVRKCFNDSAKADRLINLELKRNPKLSRDVAAKYAVESLMRDNR